MKTGVQTPVFAVKTDKSKEAVGSHAQNKNEASAKADTSFMVRATGFEPRPRRFACGR